MTSALFTLGRCGAVLGLVWLALLLALLRAAECSPTLAQHLSHLLLHAEALTLASPLLTDAVAAQLTAHCQHLRVLRLLRPSFTADAIVSLLTSAPSLSEVPPPFHAHTRTR